MPAKSRTTRNAPLAAPVIAPDILAGASVALTPLAGVANAAPAATALSGGFKSALGKKPAGFHDDGKGANAAALTRLAKAGAGEPHTKAVSNRQPSIGPRSGHR